MAQPLTMQQKAESNFCWPQQQQEQVQILAHNFQTSHNKQRKQQQQQHVEKLVKSKVKCSEEIKNVRLQKC